MIQHPAYSSFGLATPVIRSWGDLVDPPVRTVGVLALTGVYGVGLIGGALWGGWKGFFAGLFAAGAVHSVVGTTVYALQSQPEYGRAATLNGSIAVLQTGIAVWLSTKVTKERRASGKAAWSLK